MTGDTAAHHRVYVTKCDTLHSMHACSCPCVHTCIYNWGVHVFTMCVNVHAHVHSHACEGTPNKNKCVLMGDSARVPMWGAVCYPWVSLVNFQSERGDLNNGTR